MASGLEFQLPSVVFQFVIDRFRDAFVVDQTVEAARDVGIVQ